MKAGRLVARGHSERPCVERKRDGEPSAALTEGSTRPTTAERERSAAVVWERAAGGFDGRLHLIGCRSTRLI